MRKVLLLILGLTLSAGAGEPPTSEDLDDRQLSSQACRDLLCLEGWLGSLGVLLDEAEAHPALFAEKPATWTLDEDRQLRQLWAGLLDHLYALEGLKRFYAGDKRPRAYALSYGAFLAQYAESLRWSALAQGRDRLEKVLDEGDGERGVPEHSFRDLKFRVHHLHTMARFSNADRKFRKLDGVEPWLAGYAADRAARARTLLKQRGLQDVLANGADIVGDLGFEAWFPAQKLIAEWMGDTKVHRIHACLIGEAQALAFAGKLKPGDLAVQRRNWYLSNVGLPGFWPHAVVYLGTPAELAAVFDADEGTRAWLKTLDGSPATLAEALKRRFPEAWEAYIAPGEDGHAHRVLEAMSEGIVFTTAEHSFAADYAAALRPRLAQVDKAKALLEAFRHWGKPYDFNFDFATDASLVCSELCWKAYLPAEGKGGITIPLIRVCGRSTLPPNEMVRVFDEQAGTEKAQLDFVAFLDGIERGDKVRWAGEAAFRASWKRPKWDIAQK